MKKGKEKIEAFCILLIVTLLLIFCQNTVSAGSEPVVHLAMDGIS